MEFLYFKNTNGLCSSDLHLKKAMYFILRNIIFHKIFLLTSPNYTLKQRSTNHSLQAKSSIPPAFFNKVLIEYNYAHLFI